MATTLHISDVAELLSEGRTHFNLFPATLVEHSIRRNEAKLAANGALVGYTNRTGRSPKDKFIIRDEMTENTVHWGAVEILPWNLRSLTLFTPASWNTCGVGTCTYRIFSAAPIPPIAFPSVSSTNTPGTTCSSANCSFAPHRTNYAITVPSSP